MSWNIPLLGTNISPFQRYVWVNDFPFHKGYVSFLEDICQMGNLYSSDGNMKWIFLIRWKAEMIVGVEFSQVVLQEKHVYVFFWGGLSSNFTFNPQTVLEMIVVFFCTCIEWFVEQEQMISQSLKKSSKV